jgi:hypothetical protein
MSGQEAGSMVCLARELSTSQNCRQELQSFPSIYGGLEGGGETFWIFTQGFSFSIPTRKERRDEQLSRLTIALRMDIDKELITRQTPIFRKQEQ